VKKTPRPNLTVLVAIILSVLTARACADQAADILSATGVKGGLVVHVGCGDGKLTAALGAGDGMVVYGLDASGADVAAARKQIRSLGVYGKVTAERWTAPRLPYASNLVNLVVGSDLGKIPMAEVMRVLAPSGTAYVKSDGKWSRTVKPRPGTIDEWTHFRHGADGNMVSQDHLVGPPRHVQWVSGPIFQRHHGIVPSITTVVSAGGRLFYSIDEATLGFAGMPDKWHIVARDAFSGVQLWKRRMGPWGSAAWSYWTEGHAARFNHPLHVRKRLVAAGDRVYATLGFNTPVVALDAATGKTVMSYQGTDYTDELLWHDGVLYLSVNDREQKPWSGKGVDPALPATTPKPSQKHVWAVNAATGKVLWKAGPFLGSTAKLDRLASMRHLNLTVGGSGVFLIDEREVIALDAVSGKETWRIDRVGVAGASTKRLDVGHMYHKLVSPNTQAVIYHNNVLYILHPAGSQGFKSGGAGIVQALEAGTGKELWRHNTATPIAYLDRPDIFGIGECIWIADRKAMTLIGLDARTGKVKHNHSIKKALDVGHHHRCYPNRASVNYAVLGRRGAEFVDLASGEVTLHHWARTGCRSGHVLANGLLYRSPDHCRCYMAFQPRGFYAMASTKAAAGFTAQFDKANPLEKGPAYNPKMGTGTSAALRSQSPFSNWPTYRHDAMRSSAATTEVPPTMSVAWQADVGGKPTPPVVAEGKVFFATEDDHRVHAYDAATGAKAWSFTAGGRVDSPPTIHAGWAVFGCRDGWVYCLRAADGKLAWRLRAAPGERRIVAFGQVESAWPVHGSVLVAGGTAWFVAGRSSMLDAGVWAYAVDVATGKLIDRKQIHEVQTETRTTGELPKGALADILVSDGEGVYLRKRRLALEAPVAGVGPADLAATKPRLTTDGGFFDTRWFHRAFWNLTAARQRATGNLIAFDARRAYVAAANAPGMNNKTFHIPAGGNKDRITGVDGRGPSWLARPNLQVGGCILFATGSAPAGKPPVDQAEGPGPKRDRRRRARKPRARTIWRHETFAVMPWAMVAAGQTLLVAGPLDKVDPKDPWASLEGRAGGVLCVLNGADGKTVKQYDLPAPPVWNGMAAAGERVYLATVDGKILCYAAK